MTDDGIRPHTEDEIEVQRRVYVKHLSKLEEMKRRNEVFAKHKVEAFSKPTPAWIRYPQTAWRWAASATALWALWAMPWTGE